MPNIRNLFISCRDTLNALDIAQQQLCERPSDFEIRNDMQGYPEQDIEESIRINHLATQNCFEIQRSFRQAFIKCGNRTYKEDYLWTAKIKEDVL